MRRREISPEFWTDEKIVELSDAAKLLFIGLWNLADREGRLEDRPKTIGFKIRPWAPHEVPSLLNELHVACLIERYESDGVPVLAIPHFKEHQHPHPKEIPSRLPSTGTCREKQRQAVESNGEPGKAGTDRAGSSGSSGSSFPSGSSGSYAAAASSAPPPKQHLAVVYEKPDKELEVWTAEDFFSWAQWKRQEAGLIGEKQRPRDLSAWYSTALMELGGNVEVLQEAFYRFGEDKFWQAKTPALPFAGFISQWDRFIPRGGSHAQS